MNKKIFNKILVIIAVSTVNALAFVSISKGNYTYGTYRSRAVRTDATVSTDYWVKPDVEVKYPNGGESLVRGDTTAIKWEAKSTDKDSKVKISIKVSFDDGVTYSDEIASDIENTGSYDWKLDKVSDNVKIKITAVDGHDLSNSDESDSSFKISEGANSGDNKDGNNSDDKNSDNTNDPQAGETSSITSGSEVSQETITGGSEPALTPQEDPGDQNQDSSGTVSDGSSVPSDGNQQSVTDENTDGNAGQEQNTEQSPAVEDSSSNTQDTDSDRPSDETVSTENNSDESKVDNGGDQSTDSSNDSSSDSSSSSSESDGSSTEGSSSE